MGLMLSVLVFFVGVVEVIDCWHHFLLHIIQPPQKPNAYHSKTGLTTNRGLHISTESKRSHVNICWPKDISPTDDLHIIKKRPHLESDRSFEDDENSVRRRSKGKLAQNDQDKFLPVNCSLPQIVIQCPDIVEPEHKDSPICSRESSPNYLELSVIVESDSSSEFDEPSQIENPEYNKRKETESLSSSQKPDEELAGNSQETNMIRGHKENPPIIARLEDETTLLNSEGTCQFKDQTLYGNETQFQILEIDNHLLSEASSTNFDLPIFTDNIVSENVMKVSCRYAPDISNSNDVSSLYAEESCTRDVNSNNNLSFTDGEFDLNRNEHEEPNMTLMNLEENEIVLNNFPLSVDKDVQHVPIFPKITLKESSPIPLGEDEGSDSSLNTSDASWMVNSRTSDRPLKIRFCLSPEEIAKQFISVTKIDLKALRAYEDCGTDLCDLENQTQKITDSKGFYTQAPLELQLEAVRVVDDIIEKAISYISKEAIAGPGILHNCNGIGCYISENEKSNSSSSSLSGIPQLPEDLKDCNHLNIPSNNGYGNHSPRQGSLETSYSIYDISVDSLQSTGIEENRRSVDLIHGTVVDVIDCTVNEKGNETLLNSNIKVHITNSTIRGNQEVCQAKDGSIALPNLECGGEISTSNSSNKEKKVTVQELIYSKEVGESSEFCKSSDKPDLLSRHSSNSTSSNSEEVVLLCQAKELKAECLNTAPPTSTQSELDTPSASGPSTSTTAEGHPDDKSFWLIFSGEYTKAMNKDWHSGHFCCWQCDESLTGQRYVLRDDHPYCIKCYESVFANGCEECSKTIGIDSKDLSYKDKHWHEACFLCNKCRVSLVDKQFGSKLDKIFCGNCYDAQFASRCDGCGQIFKAGTKKMEYKTRQWHEPCFSCCVCKSAIGTKSFIPREQEIYCASCYEEKFATRCVKCNKVITSGGVTYKNEPWHRECFTCTNCNTSLAGQRFTSKEEKPYCADCFGELFAKRCTACCKPITGIGGTRFVSFEDRHWHNDCFICASCKTSLVGRGFITDGDDIICPECAKQKLM